MQTMSIVRKLHRSLNLRAWLIAALIVTLVESTNTASAQCQYEITAIIEGPTCPPPFELSPVTPTAINDHGVVTGFFNPCLIGNPRPFIWSEETGFVVIPLPPGVSDASPTDINNNNEIVGTFNDFSTGALPFHWKDGVWTNLPLLPGFPEAHVFAINDKSEIVGESFDAFSFSPFRALLWCDSEVTELLLPVGSQSSATDINNSSQITGWMGEGGGTSTSVGFQMSEGNVAEIPLLPNGIRNDPVAINEQGAVTGVTLMPIKSGFFQRRSWLFENGVLTDLGMLPDINHATIARDINDVNQVVGFSESLVTQAAFVWQHGEIHNLNTLIEPPQDFLVIRSANGINNNGIIIATDNDGIGYVITPIDRPLGDVNLDCTVDEYDLIVVLEDWGQNKNGHSADIVASATFAPPGDGRVDGADLAVVLGNWTPKPETRSRSASMTTPTR